MIVKGNPHSDGAVLARYLVAGKNGERAELWHLRGFASPGIVDAFRSVHVIASGTKCEAPFFHVYVRNREGETLDRDQWEYTANRIERMLGLKDQPRAIAFHISEDTGHPHMHIAWSRIDAENLTAKPLPFYKQRLKKISREIEDHFGLMPVRNQRESAIRYAPTRGEEQQARRLGLDIHHTRETIRKCFEGSNCGHSFQAALTQERLTLARGDRRDFLVIDQRGGMHALGKRILGVSAAKIRDRLADMSRSCLPTVQEARQLTCQHRHGTQRMKPGPTTRPPAYAPINEEALPPALLGARRDTECPRITGAVISQEQPAPTTAWQATVLPVAATPQQDDPGQLAILPQGRQEVQLIHIVSRISEPAAKELSLLEPQDKAEPRPSLGDRVRSRFRAVMKAVTRRDPRPRPKPRRRTGETSSAFRLAARKILGRIIRMKVVAFDVPELWQWNDPDRAYQDMDNLHYIEPNHLFPHLWIC
jgi:hypothetical protein